MAGSQCTHEGATGDFQVCVHLLEDKTLEYYVKSFTGIGKTYHLICRACAQQPEAVEPALRPVDEACFKALETKLGWASEMLGRPEVRFEPSDLAFEHRVVEFPEFDTDPVRAIRPLPQGSDSVWIGVTAAGALLRIDCNDPALEPIGEVLPEELDLAAAIELGVSPDGRWAAVFNPLGVRGVVIDLESGWHSMPLQRRDYHADVSPFPVAFWMYQGRTLLVHGTDWNRVDISDPATGELLTPREPGPYRQGGPRPEHALDYFHGRLTISPDQRWIADDGWVWQPMGVVVSWDLCRWLEENVWESEDGPSIRYLESYAWKIPMAWKDERTLMVWGYGSDDPGLIPAVQFWDAPSGKFLDWFPGPEAGDFIFDGYLFSVSRQGGIAVWDVERGVGLLRDESFAPVAYHPGTREFLTLRSGGRLQLSWLRG